MKGPAGPKVKRLRKLRQFLGGAAPNEVTSTRLAEERTARLESGWTPRNTSQRRREIKRAERERIRNLKGLP